MGFLMTAGIMIAATAYLWKRWRKTAGAKTAVTLFALVVLYPIIAGSSLENIWLGYLATLLLSAPIPALMFVNWGHPKTGTIRRHPSHHKEHLQPDQRPSKPDWKRATTLIQETTGGRQAAPSVTGR